MGRGVWRIKARVMWVSLVLLAGVAWSAPGVSAAQVHGPSNAVLAAGTVVALQGTPHLWIADEAGVLHWGADTRGLQGHEINWGSRMDVSVDALKAMPRGDPWLSAGLLKDGNPIYLVKWETNDSAPKLLHIQSITDVELFGINAGNYGTFVIDRPQWEQRFGFSASTLQRAELASADTSTVQVNQPMRIRSASSDSSRLRTELGRVEFTLVSVERAGPNSLLWHFSLWNHRDFDTDWARTYGNDHAYLVSANGTKYVGLDWGPVDTSPGERKTFAIAFPAPAGPDTYRLFLTSAGIGNIITWEPVSVTLP